MELTAGRPYSDVDSLVETASSELDGMSDEEWLAAVRAHPRIGEGGGDTPEASADEQKRAMTAASQTLDALAVENRRYEDRFGHVFLIAASGRTGEEILAELRRRMSNDKATELGEARREMRKIVRLRIGKMLSA